MDLELFGEEGEGGRPKKIGAFERAHGGTLFLDEVADMPRETQGRILRVLVEQRFRRVNGEQNVQVDVRVISSTSKNLREEIEAERFREGPVPSPQRGAGCACRGSANGARDIAELVDHFIERIAEATACPNASWARTPSPRCRCTTGLATCASFATTWSG